MNKQEFISYCENSQWANDWINGIGNFFGQQPSDQRKAEIKRKACRDRANGINFPISQQMADYMLGGKGSNKK